MATIIFDFDGTLTIENKNLWRRLWDCLGYKTDDGSYYKQLYKDFENKKITHSDWCKLTCQAYQANHLTKCQFDGIVSSIILKPDASDMIKKLYSQGHNLHIVSGNIYEAIMQVLGDLAPMFSSINANHFVFNNAGELQQVVGTKYDFEGKAKFINELCQQQNISKSQVYFVGNGKNDEWVHLSGCKTICITPEKDVSVDDKTKWNKQIDNLINVTDLIV